MPPSAQNTNAARALQVLTLLKAQPLRGSARALGLHSEGRKADLIERLQMYISAAASRGDDQGISIANQIFDLASAGEPLPHRSVVQAAIRNGTDLPSTNGPNCIAPQPSSSSQGVATSAAHLQQRAPVTSRYPSPLVVPTPMTTATVSTPAMCFAPSPFFRLRRMLRGCPVRACMAPETRGTAKLTFIVDVQEQLLLDSQPNMELLVFCAKKTEGSPYALLEFPHPLELNLNGVTIKDNVKGIKNQPGTSRPAALTSAYRRAPHANTFEMVYAFTKTDFFVSLYIVERFTPEHALKAVTSRPPIARAHTVSKIKGEFNHDDDEIEEVSSTLSLKCPLSYMRMKTPCKSLFCQHLQCFDGLSFLQLQEQVPSWMCPVCSTKLKYEDLAVCTYMEEILAATGEDDEVVELEDDGGWKVKIEEEAPRGAGEARANKPIRGEDESARGPGPDMSISNDIEVISLDSDSEDELQPPPKPDAAPVGTAVKAEKERAESERVERELVERERMERERVDRERMERERMESERVERERAERERVERERVERVERERVEREKVERERVEREKVERERVEKEKVERERVEKETVERERVERERVERERVERERVERERVERERVERERVERERVERERVERERVERERAEMHQRELIRREHMQNEKLEKLRTQMLERQSVDKNSNQQTATQSSAIKIENSDLKTKGMTTAMAVDAPQIPPLPKTPVVANSPMPQPSVCVGVGLMPGLNGSLIPKTSCAPTPPTVSFNEPFTTTGNPPRQLGQGAGHRSAAAPVYQMTGGNVPAQTPHTGHRPASEDVYGRGTVPTSFFNQRLFSGKETSGLVPTHTPLVAPRFDSAVHYLNTPVQAAGLAPAFYNRRLQAQGNGWNVMVCPESLPLGTSPRQFSISTSATGEQFLNVIVPASESRKYPMLYQRPIHPQRRPSHINPAMGTFQGNGQGPSTAPLSRPAFAGRQGLVSGGLAAGNVERSSPGGPGLPSPNTAEHSGRSPLSAATSFSSASNSPRSHIGLFYDPHHNPLMRQKQPPVLVGEREASRIGSTAAAGDRHRAYAPAGEGHRNNTLPITSFGHPTLNGQPQSSATLPSAFTLPTLMSPGFLRAPEAQPPVAQSLKVSGQERRTSLDPGRLAPSGPPPLLFRDMKGRDLLGLTVPAKSRAATWMPVETTKTRVSSYQEANPTLRGLSVRSANSPLTLSAPQYPHSPGTLSAGPSGQDVSQVETSRPMPVQAHQTWPAMSNPTLTNSNPKAQPASRFSPLRFQPENSFDDIPLAQLQREGVHLHLSFGWLPAGLNVVGTGENRRLGEPVSPKRKHPAEALAPVKKPVPSATTAEEVIDLCWSDND